MKYHETKWSRTYSFGLAIAVVTNESHIDGFAVDGLGTDRNWLRGRVRGEGGGGYRAKS